MGKKAKMVVPVGFRKIKINGEFAYVKKLSMGGELHLSGRDEFRVYSKTGMYLGWVGDEEEGQYMAAKGFTNTPHRDEAPELALWALWNDAISGGTEFLLGDDGTQVLAVGGGMFIAASQDDTGWNVEIITETDLYDRYGSDQFECVVELVPIPASQAFRIE